MSTGRIAHAVRHMPFIVNCTSSVSLVFLNKQLMNTCSFHYLGFLAALHTGTTYMFASGYVSPTSQAVSRLTRVEVVTYLLLILASLVFMNLSLMLNNVGVYQISKLAMIPVCCLLEFIFERKRVKSGAFAGVMLLMVGVMLACVPDSIVSAIKCLTTNFGVAGLFLK